MSATLRQLDALNIWLGDVFGEGTRFSGLLTETGFTDAEINTIKSNYLTDFIQGVVDLVANSNHGSERRNRVMVRRYGLLDGNPETLQSIGTSMELSRERIRQLVQKHIRFYSSSKRQEQFKADITSIARRLLDGEEVAEQDNPKWD